MYMYTHVCVYIFDKPLEPLSYGYFSNVVKDINTSMADDYQDNIVCVFVYVHEHTHINITRRQT